jgi:hypothetical protein
VDERLGQVPGFGQCGRCLFNTSGPAELCFACARRTMEPLAARRCGSSAWTLSGLAAESSRTAARLEAARERETLAGRVTDPGAWWDDFRRLAATASEPSPRAICSYNPADVPLVLDTIPPSGMNVQTELDPTVNPSGVQLQGVTVTR